jgi:hypothetical protein
MQCWIWCLQCYKRWFLFSIDSDYENGVVYFVFLSCDQVLHGLEKFQATLHLTPLFQYDLYILPSLNFFSLSTTGMLLIELFDAFGVRCTVILVARLTGVFWTSAGCGADIYLIVVYCSGWSLWAWLNIPVVDGWLIVEWDGFEGRVDWVGCAICCWCTIGAGPDDCCTNCWLLGTKCEVDGRRLQCWVNSGYDGGGMNPGNWSVYGWRWYGGGWYPMLWWLL